MKKEDYNIVTICFSDQLDQERQRWRNRPTDQNERLTGNLKTACGVFKTLPKALFDSTDKTYHRPYLTRFGSSKQLSLDDQYRLLFKFEEGHPLKSWLSSLSGLMTILVFMILSMRRMTHH